MAQDDEIVSFDLNKIKLLIPKYSSHKLCEMIVCQRYFGFDQEMGVLCMQELAIRRANGDNFNFEEYIDSSLASLPALSFNIPDLRTVLSSWSKK